MLSLIERVRAINPEAAEFLEKNKENPEYTWGGDSLLSLMVWFKTPQNHLYWENISRSLGEFDTKGKENDIN